MCRASSIFTLVRVRVAILICGAPKWPIGRDEANIIVGEERREGEQQGVRWPGGEGS